MKSVIITVVLAFSALAQAPKPGTIVGASGGGVGTGTVTSVATACGLTGGTITTTGTISQALTPVAHNGSYAILTTDCGLLLSTNVAAAWTIAQAGTTGFEVGKFWRINNVGSGALTITATISTFYGGPTSQILGSVLTVLAGSGVTIASDGTHFQVVVSYGGSLISKGTYASLPGICSTGDVYFFTDSVFNAANCTSNVWTVFYQGKSITPAASISLTSALQAGVTVSSTHGYEAMTFTAAGTATRSFRTWTAPANGTKQTVFLNYPYLADPTASFRTFYVGFQDGSGNQLGFECGAGLSGGPSNGCRLMNGTNGAFTGAAAGAYQPPNSWGGPAAIVLLNDGTNLNVGVSFDGGDTSVLMYKAACTANSSFANCTITKMFYGGEDSAADPASPAGPIVPVFELIGIR